MKNYSGFLGVFILLFSHLSYAQESSQMSDKTPFTIGETLSFHSEILDEERKINVYLPASYNTDSDRQYPVIYLLDGSAHEDFIHIAGLVQFCSFPWTNKIEETIVVGIANVDRKRDFTYPTTVEKDKKAFPTTGQSANFIAFLEKELQPIVKKHYRVTGEKTLIGQSLGGLIATEILYKKTRLFDHYIIVSPSLWWDKESLLAIKPKKGGNPKSIYVAVGVEGPTMERVARDLYDKLQKEERKNTQLYFQFFEDRNHTDVLHTAVLDAFEKMFRKEKSTAVSE